MIVYPAIDLRRGRVVRLKYGDPAQETVHSDDPVAVAERWRAAGAVWLHVVNLDGALGEATLALDALRAIAGAGLPVQFGGGLRSLADAARALDAGAARVVLGTLAAQQPDAAGEAVTRFGAGAVTVALDARGGSGDDARLAGRQRVDSGGAGRALRADGRDPRALH
ncbi:MAG: HisA/HisF-related TIM barrel protein [Anaerolineae bacterium]|nr:HisA/HisF-related TIM barrel protein [Anaerolineae bacterium]